MAGRSVSYKFLSSFNVWLRGTMTFSKSHHCANTNYGGNARPHKNIDQVTNEIVIKGHEKGNRIPYDLLLIADPSKENVDKYISDSFIYTADLNGETIGCYVLYHVDKDCVSYPENYNGFEVQSANGKSLVPLFNNHPFPDTAARMEKQYQQWAT